MTLAKLFDTHAHLDDEQFDGIRDEVVRRANATGVATMVAVGTTAGSSEQCVALAHQYAGVHAAVGIQPNYCATTANAEWDQITALVDDPCVVALGETGLDKYWDHTPFEIQQDFFARHLRLSQETGLPVVVHMRDCGKEVVDSLEQARKWGPLRGVMHSFTGDADLASACVELGLYISFAGMVTFNKSDELRAVAKAIPAERLLIETDSPYLSPHPKRGQRPNEPALIVHTAACLAKLRGVTFEELAALTTANAKTLFFGNGK